MFVSVEVEVAVVDVVVEVVEGLVGVERCMLGCFLLELVVEMEVKLE